MQSTNYLSFNNAYIIFLIVSAYFRISSIFTGLPSATDFFAASPIAIDINPSFPSTGILPL